MKLIGGFLNENKLAPCNCKPNMYVLPLVAGDEFFLIVEDENRAINTNFAYTLVGVFGNKKIYKFSVSALQALSTSNQLNWGGFARNINFYCTTPVGDYCETTIADLCFEPFEFGQTCFRPADCYDSVLEWGQKYGWYPNNGGRFDFRQRLPIRLFQPQPKIDGVKTYQKSSGLVVRTGKVRSYVEYTLETEFMPENFHRRLVEVLTRSVYLKIDGKLVEFAGDYQINWERKNDCFARATCKIIEKTGLPTQC